MSLREFKISYTGKLKKYQRFSNNTIVPKAYSRLLKGTEIRFNEFTDVKDKNAILKLLIDITQVRSVREFKNQIFEEFRICISWWITTKSYIHEQ